MTGNDERTNDAEARIASTGTGLTIFGDFLKAEAVDGGGRVNHEAGACSSPMNGWRVSGVVHSSELPESLLVQRLNGSESWPDPELHDGVAGIKLQTWADDTGGGYLTVWGPDRGACEARWYRVATSLDFDVTWRDNA